MIKWLMRVAAVIVLLAVAAFWQLFISARPPVTTDPVTLAGDGSTINYCELSVLDGSGKAARDIPKGNTPGCAYEHFPLPILAECNELGRSLPRCVNGRCRPKYRVQIIQSLEPVVLKG